MLEPFGQKLHVLSVISASFLRWSWGLEDAFNLVIDTCATWLLTVALDFSLSAANASRGRPSRNSHGSRSADKCSRHNVSDGIDPLSDSDRIES